MDNRELWPGWKTERLIGRGSFGAVYEIQRDVFGDVEKAALKVISIPQNDSDIDELYSDGYDEESITTTFQSHLKSVVAEYSLMRKMNGSANIVNCDDMRYIQHDDGIGWDIFIKMELLTPLTKALPAEFSEETAIKIAKDICSALELCKKYGIVHRDIKPQNIFVSPNGDYKLGDFGIAKTVEKTMGGTKIGTYKFMAPEVYNNEPYGSAADIYSLGLVLYWLLNERRMPFVPLPPAKLTAGMEETARSRRLAGEQFADPKNGSRQLKLIVMKACAYRAEDRYASAGDMLRDLNRIFRKESEAVHVNDSPIGTDSLEQEAQVYVSTVSSNSPKLEEKLYVSSASSNVPEQEEAAAEIKVEEKCIIPSIVRGPERIEEPVSEPEQVRTVFDSKTTESLSKMKSKSSKRTLIIGVVAVVLIAVIAIFLLSSGSSRNIPNGTKLIEGSWDNGELVVVALDAGTLWVQIEDSRRGQQYMDMGSAWQIELDFGSEMSRQNEDGSRAVSYPFRIILSSPVLVKALHGGVCGRNLSFTQNVEDDGFRTVTESADDCIIERNNNIYTAEITLPEWFDVSVHEDLTLATISVWDIGEGRGQSYDFEP